MSEENRLESSDATADETEAEEEMTEFGPEAEAEAAIPETESQSEEEAEAASQKPCPSRTPGPRNPLHRPGLFPKRPSRSPAPGCFGRPLAWGYCSLSWPSP